MRVVVLGTYRSGSSAVAGVLNRLGVNLGAPYWGEYFESEKLSEMLRAWWSEPKLRATVSTATRIEELRRWIDGLETSSAESVDVTRVGEATSNVKMMGAKHPLLCLSAFDISAAWGPETRFIWTRRLLEDSIRSLEQQGWWSDSERIQRTLFEAAERFFADEALRERCLVIEHQSMLADPVDMATTLAAFLQIKVTAAQIEDAVTPLKQFVSKASESIRSELDPARHVHGSHASAGTSIDATMISGNSESMVRDAVMSVIDYVDQVVLIDTGISDATEQIVRGNHHRGWYQRSSKTLWRIVLGAFEKSRTDENQA